MIAHVHSVRVGKPALHQDSLGEWTTALLKREKDGEVWAGADNLDGDRQADLTHHGGVDKAICVYPIAHYDYWNNRLGVQWRPGDFGENLTVEGLDEEVVAIGDIFEIGEALVQVTQPRSPCWKIARFHGIKKLALYVQETGFTGWYLRVLREGFMKAGSPIVLKHPAAPRLTVQDANNIAYSDKDPSPLLECAALSHGWRKKFEEKLRSGQSQDPSKRLYGN